MKPLLRRVVQISVLTIVFGFFSFSLYPQTFADASGTIEETKLSRKPSLVEQSSSLLIQVSGTVNDENGARLPGVNVLEKGTTNGTTTDANGSFSFNVRDENSVLVFSFIGYVTQEIPVGAQTQ